MARRRYRLSHGGRPKGIGDDAELLVARVAGRNLRWREALVVQIGAVALVALIFYWLLVSGTMTTVGQMFGEWMADSVFRSIGG